MMISGPGTKQPARRLKTRRDEARREGLKIRQDKTRQAPLQSLSGSIYYYSYYYYYLRLLLPPQNKYYQKKYYHPNQNKSLGFSHQHPGNWSSQFMSLAARTSQTRWSPSSLSRAAAS
jgi:hypothetical protein